MNSFKQASFPCTASSPIFEALKILVCNRASSLATQVPVAPFPNCDLFLCLEVGKSNANVKRSRIAALNAWRAALSRNDPFK